MGVRVGVDVGGTFTDFVVFNEATGRLAEFKVPSTGSEPAEAVVAGFRRLVDEGTDPGDIGLFSHGTTVALNTLLECSGARVGLIVTRGFRDVLQLRRLRITGAPGFNIRQPVPLVPRRHIREVGGRLLADGTEARPLELGEVVAAATELVEAGCQAIAICLLHAYRNRTHEQRAAEAVRQALPGVHLTVSSEVWPQQREYERTEVSVINAHVAPVMERYYGNLAGSLRELGVSAHVLATKSSGGVMSAESAARRPVDTLLSGPAAGVVAAAWLGQIAGFDRLVAFDMGGTSADVGLVDAGKVRTTTEATVGDFPVVIPSVDVSSIGAGGGSVATVDAAGVLKVGPRSAGSVPGPACYGRGGQEPTVTDAYATLGVITELLGGEMRLDLGAARTACEGLGERLGMGVGDTAEAILKVATANMYARLLPLMAQRGADPREFALLAYGGAGPTHAFRLAAEVGFTRIVVPPSPGTFCALGCLLADVRADFVATVYADIDRMSEQELVEVFATLRRQAEGWLESEAVSARDATVGLSADMRYAGQSYEIPVTLPASLGPGFQGAVRSAFHSAYERIYGEADRGGRIEIVNARAQLVATTPKPAPAARVVTPGAQTTRRAVRHDGVEVDAVVVARDELPIGHRLDGPAVVTQYDTTTFVPPRAHVAVDAEGNLVGGFSGPCSASPR